jgi:cell filamentation protein
MRRSACRSWPLSDDLHGVALLVRSVDASYAYEGYDAYRAEDLGLNGVSGAAR